MSLIAKYRLPLIVLALGLCALFSFAYSRSNKQEVASGFDAASNETVSQPLKTAPLEIEAPFPATPKSTIGVSTPNRESQFHFGKQAAGTKADNTLTEEQKALNQQRSAARTERLIQSLDLDKDESAQLIALSTRYQESRERIREAPGDNASKRAEVAALSATYRENMRELLKDSAPAQMISKYQQRVEQAQANSGNSSAGQ